MQNQIIMDFDEFLNKIRQFFINSFDNTRGQKLLDEQQLYDIQSTMKSFNNEMFKNGNISHDGIIYVSPEKGFMEDGTELDLKKDSFGGQYLLVSSKGKGRQVYKSNK